MNTLMKYLADRARARLRRAKTFSIAIFCSALALSKGLEIVVFSKCHARLCCSFYLNL
jgi:hypothetical protein